MRKVGLKFGGRAWAVSQARTTKVVVTQRRETQKRKKTTKKEKRSDTEKEKKSHFGHRGARPHGLPKRARRLLFGPQMRPDSGFSYQLGSPFNSYRKFL